MAKSISARTDVNDGAAHGGAAQAAGAAARERLLAEMPIGERRLHLAGLSTLVLEGGAGPPLVLLHGPGGYGAQWLCVIPDLVGSYRVVAPDLPGHGASQAPEAALDDARMLAWLDELIEHCCPAPPVLVGHALGGAIAARYASAHGERLAALVLVDALGLVDFSPPPDFGAALMEHLSDPTERTYDRLWQLCAHDFDALRRGLGERWDWIKAYNLERARVPALRATQQELMQAFGLRAMSAEQLARIAVPTVLIWGRHDPVTPLSVAQGLAARHGWPLHAIDAAGADAPLERPEAFLRALHGALDGVGASAASAQAAAWDRIAPGYDRTNTPTQMALADVALRRAGLRAGMRLLDVAAGSGALSVPAARMGASVLAIDRSRAMLELLARRARDEGLAIETRVMDGEALELADGGFDLVGSQFGVMLFADMPRGLREMARVARAGARVLVVAYGEPQRIDFLRFLIGAVQTVRPAFTGPPAEHPPLEFQLADPQRLRNELAAAGLQEIDVATISEVTEFADGDALWDWIVCSNPIVEKLLGELELTQGETGQVKRALQAMVRERAGSERAARLSHPINVGIATR